VKPKDKGSGDCGATPSKKDNIQHRYSAEIEDDSKAAVQSALIAYTLRDLDDGGCRWKCRKEAPCLRCVDVLLRRIGGRT